MIKTTKTKVYNTELDTLVKKVTYGVYGDPAGYEMAIYITEQGDYYLYTYGGEQSPYPVEKITSFTKKKAIAWITEN